MLPSTRASKLSCFSKLHSRTRRRSRVAFVTSELWQAFRTRRSSRYHATSRRRTQRNPFDLESSCCRCPAYVPCPHWPLKNCSFVAQLAPYPLKGFCVTCTSRGTSECARLQVLLHCQLHCATASIHSTGYPCRQTKNYACLAAYSSFCLGFFASVAGQTQQYTRLRAGNHVLL